MGRGPRVRLAGARAPGGGEGRGGVWRGRAWRAPWVPRIPASLHADRLSGLARRCSGSTRSSTPRSRSSQHPRGFGSLFFIWSHSVFPDTGVRFIVCFVLFNPPSYYFFYTSCVFTPSEPDKTSPGDPFSSLQTRETFPNLGRGGWGWGSRESQVSL